MIKVMNMSTYDCDLERFNHDSMELEKFLKENNLDGIELLEVENLNEKSINRDLIKGVHLSSYSNWMDFWREDREALLNQFKDENEIKKYYGALDKETLIEKYRKEIKMADKIGAKYVVFHVFNVAIREAYDLKFKYSNEEIINETIDLVNQILNGLNCSVTILFENLWWTGLTLLENNIIEKLMSGIQYKNKGIMLDTGHLLHNNMDIKNSNEAALYIIKVLENLKENIKYIKGIHLNYSDSYDRKKEIEILKNGSIEEMKENLFYYIMKIDQHKPFESEKVREIIRMCNPDYLTYEFITSTVDELKEFIKIQNNILK